MGSNNPATHSPRPHTLLLLRSPQLWPTWPFLPVTRDPPEGGPKQLGVVYDAFHATGQCGFSASVFLCNIFGLPNGEEAILALPRCTYDTFEEMIADGWRID